ncbi:MAG: CBS domain-containing protein [Acetobacteraceae bacterium]|nr:CBS domain-containing protein [Acetobacteraceae bacterium]
MLDEATFTAGDLMTRDVAVVHPDSSLLEAVKLMAQRRISGMPVVDENGGIVGMLSEGDLLRWHEGYTERQARWLDMLAEGTDLAPSFLERIKEQHRKVRSVMAVGAISVTEDTAARAVAHLMHTRHVKRVPVVRDGKLVGILARSDLVRALARHLGETPREPKVSGGTVNEALRRAREERDRSPPGS